ncbi:MAG: acetoacetate--CoA ligase [Coxiella sp. RIFCSPHIGHO2_12_FULL_42_15]|nr:MAG: acetoacetate--CoA ligase [Coxiella sp. RIFCSPHIGHO2_12_FULL_42_15]
MTQPLWSPNPEEAEHSYLAEFMRYLNHADKHSFFDYPSLHHWSVQHPEKFWHAVWNFCEIKYSAPPQKIMQRATRMQDTRWFIGAKLNFAENLLKRDDQHIAIIATNERGEYHTLTYARLRHLVANLAHRFRTFGLKAGDRVVAMLPNTPEAVIAMLATTSLGAIWSACSPDFGVESIVDRFSQIEPKIFLTVDGHFYKGKNFHHLEKNIALQTKLPSVRHTILVSYLEKKADISQLKNAIHFNDCLTVENQALDFPQFAFDHPVYILYSSGTTGKPKCMVHGAGGTLLQHLKELMLHTNVSPNKRIFFNSTTTWMMWHWLVSNLAIGASIVLYEGAPFYPTPQNLYTLIDRADINIFGVGAKFFEISAKINLKPNKTHDLSSLTTILSTGSPLLPSSFDYIYQEIKKSVQVSSISGGSDIISCFALGNPLLPVYRGELQCCGLGMDIKIFDESGHAVIQQKGELVCASPFPSMPIYFWNDPEGIKYQKAYFERFDNIWAHGDFAMLTTHHGVIIFGRSDATLNPSGVRIGSAEIYQQLEKVDEILESLVVGQLWKNDERIILFVVPKPNVVVDNELCTRIKNLIRIYTSPYHVPAKIIAVTDIPRTVNNKISEIAVKKMINGEPIDNLQALANPESLEQFSHLPELQKD